MITPLPSPPTDNLYKFLAIGGVVLIVGGGVLLANVQRDAEREEARVRADEAAIRVIRDELETLRPSLFARDSVTRASILRTDADSERLRRWWELRRQEAILAARSRAGLEITARRLDESSTDFLLLSLYGLVSTTLGFIGWYFRFQRYQDELVRHQVEQQRKAVASAQARVENGT